MAQTFQWWKHAQKVRPLLLLDHFFLPFSSPEATGKEEDGDGTEGSDGNKLLNASAQAHLLR